MDDDRRIRVFFYGLFMDERLLTAKGMSPRAARVGSARAGWPGRFARPPWRWEDRCWADAARRGLPRTRALSGFGTTKGSDADLAVPPFLERCVDRPPVDHLVHHVVAVADQDFLVL